VLKPMPGSLALTETVPGLQGHWSLLVLISGIFGPEYPKMDEGGGGGAALLIARAVAAPDRKDGIVETILWTVPLFCSVWQEDEDTVVVGKVEEGTETGGKESSS